MIARYGEFATISVKTELAITSASVQRDMSWSMSSIAELILPLARPLLFSPMVGICSLVIFRDKALSTWYGLKIVDRLWAWIFTIA